MGLRERPQQYNQDFKCLSHIAPDRAGTIQGSTGPFGEQIKRWGHAIQIAVMTKVRVEFPERLH